MTDREMNPISQALDLVKSRLLEGVPAEQAPLIAWPYVCGQRVAQNARAVRYEEQILTVVVADEGWRRELTGMAASYLARLNQVLPEGARIKRISFERS